MAALGGLNLSSLATQAGAETGARMAGGQSTLAAALSSMLAEQQGMLASKGEAQGRDNTFARAQAMLAESLAQRESALRDAETMARQRFEEEQGNLQRAYLAQEGGRDRAHELAQAAARRAAEERDARSKGGEPDWFTQQVFQTDENIRQAKALAALERQYRQQDADSERKSAEPRLSDYGGGAIDVGRGRAIATAKPGSISQGPWSRRLAAGNYISKADRDKTATIIEKYGTDPGVLVNKLRDHFGDGRLGAQRASYALYELGYGGVG